MGVVNSVASRSMSTLIFSEPRGKRGCAAAEAADAEEAGKAGAGCAAADSGAGAESGRDDAAGAEAFPREDW